MHERFAALVQSPLRAALLRFLFAHPRESFHPGQLMQTFGRMRLDVENCLLELETFGVAERRGRARDRWAYRAPPAQDARQAVAAFARQDAAPTQEDRSEAAGRLRELIGHDEKMLVVLEWVRTAAKADIAVLITGPTGSGKDIVARAIHDLSARRNGPFQPVNCAALPDALFESEMFGHEKGAFTGAAARRAGRLELANGGTLFLDGITDLSPAAQAKLLRAIEHRRFERLGGQRAIATDFRVISAASQPVDLLVRAGSFREDLYYRVNAFAIRLPSLRERAADIPMVAGRMLERLASAQGMPPGAVSLSGGAIKALRAHDWPGNIRELEATLLRAIVRAGPRALRAADIELAPAAAGGGPAAAQAVERLADLERRHIAGVLARTGWNKLRTAELLGISRTTLYRKIVEHGIDRGREM